MTLLHSVWQMFLLLMVYYAVTGLFRNWPPLAKRNLLLSAIGIQFISSLLTFFIIFLGPGQNNFDNRLVNTQWLSPATGIPQQWFIYLLLIYTGGMFYKLLGSYLQWKSYIGQLKNSLQKAPAELRLFTQQKAIAFGIKRTVEIWFSQHISSPLTYGFFKPVILFPLALCSSLSLSQAEALIVHELTHIRTRDYFFNWLLVIAEAIYFFNPFVKILAKKIRFEREKNCDITVINFKYPAINYAEALLRVAQHHAGRNSMAIAAVHNRNELLKRIEFFSITGAKQKSDARLWPAISLMFALLFFVSSAILNLNRKIENTGTAYVSGPIVLHTGFEQRYNSAESFAVVTQPVDPAGETIADEHYKAERTNTAPAAATEIIATENFKEEAGEPLAGINTIDFRPANNLVHQVSFTTTTDQKFTAEQDQVIKEMIVTEENSKGEKITKSFTVILENGEWKVLPQWMYTERALTDSLKAAIKLDSTTYRVFPTVQ